MGNCLCSGGTFGAQIARVTPELLKRPKDPKVIIKGALSPKVGEIIEPNLKEFSYQELKIATKNFKQEIGKGGFGTVYKGYISEKSLAPSKPGDGIPVAIKKCNSNSAQGFKEWNAEINFLGEISHPNLVKLIGYCKQDKELLLVYELMQKGSLETHLFQKKLEVQSWSTRIKVAIDAARGLDFLHTTEKTVIYRDFKAANILLDKDYTAKLSDFGIARLGPPTDKSHVTTQAVGTYGYAAPEYVQTNHLYVSSDVYCFGVVLLELLTGMRAYDTTRPSDQISLVDWRKPMLSDKSKLKKIVDPNMEDYSFEGVNKLAQLILRCLEIDPKVRPHMSEVLLILEQISAIRVKPKASKPKYERPMRSHSYYPSPIGSQRGTSPRPQPSRSRTY